MSVRFVNTAPFMCATAGDPPAPAAAAPAAAAPAAAAPAAAAPAPAPAANPPPWGTDVNKMWMINDKPWFETTLQDGPTKELMRSKQYANPAVVADSYYGANRMVNGNVVEVPPADAKPEVWEALDVKLGRLEAPEKYEFKMADGVTADEGMIKFGQNLAFKLGLPPHKAQAMVDEWNKMVGEANTATTTAEQAANTAELEATKTKWGEKFDEFSAAGKRVTQALFDLKNPKADVVASEAALLGKIEGAIGASAMLELFARIGAKTAEGKMLGGDTAPNDNTENMTKEQANVEINRLRADPEFGKKFNDANHPEHAAALDRMNRLYAKANTA